MVLASIAAAVGAKSAALIRKPMPRIAYSPQVKLSYITWSAVQETGSGYFIGCPLLGNRMIRPS